MTSAAKNPLHRLWSKGKEGVYLVNTNNENFSSPRNHKRSIHSNFRASVRSYSLENADDSAKKHQQIPRDSSFDDSMLEENRSLDSFADEEDVWESMLPDENVMLLSTHRKGSLALDQILLDINTEKKENGVKKPENENDEYADIDVKAIAAAISKQRDSAGSEMDSDSDTDTAVSEGSDLDDDSSDEESDGESENEAFDIEYHINKLVKGNNESDSDDNDSDSDGNESVNSEKVFQKAVQKVIKKFKRERCGEIKGSDSESTQTSEKGSETEESPTSDDSASETSDQENDASDVSSRKSFQMERDDDPEIAELVDDGLDIDPRNGKHDGKETQTVYKYDLNENEPIDSSPEKAESYSAKAVGPPKENGKDHADDLASTLEDSKAQDLRWPFSNFYIKEFKQDPEMSFSDSEDALPSYRSTAASASYPGRKKNVMLGRVWWVEWWAKDDSRKQESPDKFNVVKLS